MREFEEAIPLMESPEITGQITVEGNQIEGCIWDIKVTDLVTGQAVESDDIALMKAGQIYPLSEVKSSHYKLSFRFRRTKGRKGLKICFGRKDAKNTLLWEFGGWDNWDCNIATICNGRSSIISHRIFHVEDKEYFLELEVKDCHIVTRVNGEIYNDTRQRVPELEDLYVTASVEAAGDKTYLKAVNLTGEEKKVEISLEGKECNRAVVTALKGYALTAVNTLEEPDRVVPVEEQCAVHNNCLTYSFAPHSVTVFSFE